MKKVLIIDDCLVPTDKPGEMRHADAGELIDLDDGAALQVVAASRGKLVHSDDIEAAQKRSAEIKESRGKRKKDKA